MPTPRPSPAEFQAARLKGLADMNAYLAELVLSVANQKAPPSPPQPFPAPETASRRFDPDQHDPEETLPAGLRASELLGLATRRRDPHAAASR